MLTSSAILAALSQQNKHSLLANAEGFSTLNRTASDYC